MRRSIGMVPLVIASCLASVSVAEAGKRRARDAAPEPAPAAIPNARMFYPQEIEGGSTGNLPFNNQIRKLTDPLNANGGSNPYSRRH